MNERAHNFVQSVFVGYKLATCLEDGAKSFGFSSSRLHPFTRQFADDVVAGFKTRGVIASVANVEKKKFPSTSLTINFQKDVAL